MEEFDFGEAVKCLREGKKLCGEGGVLTGLIKRLTEAALEAELEEQLSGGEFETRRNGRTKKLVKSSVGSFELETPRDRVGIYEPQLVKKHQRVLTEELDAKILSMYSLGMSYRDIEAHVKELYGLEVSPATISGVTDKIMGELNQWKQRPLDSLYPIVWLDAIFFKMKDDGRYCTKALHTLLGVNMEGKKEILGIYLSDNEGAHHWLSVLTELKNRGVNDILIACVDGLKGFPEAIASVFPQTEIQLCVVHQIRNSLKHVGAKDQREFLGDLKGVYRATSKSSAEVSLDFVEKKWGNKYPVVIDSWRRNWDNLSGYFKYPEPIRNVIYTTNAVEAVHRQFRKLTKTKGAFPNEESLLKLLYVGILNATKKWSRPIANWPLALSQFAIYFKGRLDDVLNISH